MLYAYQPIIKYTQKLLET